MGVGEPVAGDADWIETRLFRRPPSVFACPGCGGSLLELGEGEPHYRCYVARTREAGFDQHLTKPVDFHRLLAAIDQLARPV